MKSFKSLSLIVLVAILFSSCARVFYSPDASTLAHSQKTIAIIPPTLSITTTRMIDAESMKEHQRTESLTFQQEMYSWMLKRKMQGRISQEILEVETTNAKLKMAGYPENPMTTAELCEVLGVDGIITSNYALSKPMSDGVAVAAALLLGAWGATNEVRVSLSISDCNHNKLIWNYNHKFSGRLGSSHSGLVERIMRQASRRMPYIK